MADEREDLFMKEYGDGKKKVVLTYDDVFLNNDAMFVEYNDVLRSIFFTVFWHLLQNEVLDDQFDTTEVSDLTIDEAYIWYVKQQVQPLMCNLPVEPEFYTGICNDDPYVYADFCNQLMYHELDSTDYYIKVAGELNFMNVLKAYCRTDLKSKVFIYSEYPSTMIERDIKSTLGEHIKYVHGNLVDVLKENKITANSTFVFSDVNKILALKEAGILEFSSILLADWFQYNYEDDMKTLKVPVEKLYEDGVFKFSFFNNIFQQE